MPYLFKFQKDIAKDIVRDLRKQSVVTKAIFIGMGAPEIALEVCRRLRRETINIVCDRIMEPGMKSLLSKTRLKRVTVNAHNKNYSFVIIRQYTTWHFIKLYR